MYLNWKYANHYLNLANSILCLFGGTLLCVSKSILDILTREEEKMCHNMCLSLTSMIDLLYLVAWLRRVHGGYNET